MKLDASSCALVGGASGLAAVPCAAAIFPVSRYSLICSRQSRGLCVGSPIRDGHSALRRRLPERECHAWVQNRTM
jgi:hypothetical protein